MGPDRDILAQLLAAQRPQTDYNRLKGFEAEMEPPAQPPYMPAPSTQAFPHMLQGMDMLDTFRMLLQPKPDPDVMASPQPRSGLRSI